MTRGEIVEERILKRIASFCVAFMTLIIVSSFLYQYESTFTISVSERTHPAALAKELDSYVSKETSYNTQALFASSFDFDNLTYPLYYEEYGINDIIQDKQVTTNPFQKELGDSFLVIDKVYGKNIELSVLDNYVSKELSIQIDGIYQCNYSANNVKRYYKDLIYKGEPIYECSYEYEKNDAGEMEEIEIRNYGDELVHNIDIQYSFDEFTLMYTAHINLIMNHVYEYTIFEDENAFYINLQRPRELYDKIIVVDAGHGGKDAGCLSIDGTIYEKDINMKIVSALKELLDQSDIKVYYTRLSDEKIFLKPRVNLANDLESDFFYSVHCNSSTSVVPKGAEVLYRDYHFEGFNNADLAKLCLNALCDVSKLENRDTVKVKEEDIYILEHSTVPAVLFEVGFLSNTHDLEYLMDDDNCEKIAQGIYNAILSAYHEYK